MKEETTEVDAVLSFEILDGSCFAFVLSLSFSIQLRFGYIWSTVAGKSFGDMNEMELFDNERINQVSGVTNEEIVTNHFRKLLQFESILKKIQKN